MRERGAKKLSGTGLSGRVMLVPTNTIREQTLEALKTVGHPYRQALENDSGLDRLRVFDVGEVPDSPPRYRP